MGSCAEDVKAILEAVRLPRRKKLYPLLPKIQRHSACAVIRMTKVMLSNLSRNICSSKRKLQTGILNWTMFPLNVSILTKQLLGVLNFVFMQNLRENSTVFVMD